MDGQIVVCLCSCLSVALSTPVYSADGEDGAFLIFQFVNIWTLAYFDLIFLMVGMGALRTTLMRFLSKITGVSEIYYRLNQS